MTPMLQVTKLSQRQGRYLTYNHGANKSQSEVLGAACLVPKPVLVPSVLHHELLFLWTQAPDEIGRTALNVLPQRLKACKVMSVG